MSHRYSGGRHSSSDMLSSAKHHSEDNDSLAEDFSSTKDLESNEPKERDEIREVQKIASKDTTRIIVWRYVVTVVLLTTALAVTLTTYYFLKEEETENFTEAVEVNQHPFDCLSPSNNRLSQSFFAVSTVFGHGC